MSHCIFVNMKKTGIHFETNYAAIFHALEQKSSDIHMSADASNWLALCFFGALTGWNFRCSLFVTADMLRVLTNHTQTLHLRAFMLARIRMGRWNRTTEMWLDKNWKTHAAVYSHYLLLLDNFKCHTQDKIISTIHAAVLRFLTKHCKWMNSFITFI